MELVRQILKAVKVLKSMKITVNGYLDSKKLCVCKELRKFQRSSQNCEIAFHEGRFTWCAILSRSSLILHVTCFALISLCNSFAAFAMSDFIPMVQCKMLEDLICICHLFQLCQLSMFSIQDFPPCYSIYLLISCSPWALLKIYFIIISKHADSMFSLMQYRVNILDFCRN